MGSKRENLTNELLGYPDDARLLLVNADDFGMYSDVNYAVTRAFKEGVVQSTSLMVPCSGATQAIRLLQADRELPFGVHLTVVRDYDHHRWGPIAPRESVPSLLDESGYFFSASRIPEMLGRAKLSELEVEFRAQIETAIAAGLQPTHLDWHCLSDGGRADVSALSFGLAREYGLALRVHDRQLARQIRSQGLPTSDHDMVDSSRIATDGKPERFARMLRELPTGLSEWAVHPGVGDAESQGIDPELWKVRQADFDFLISSEARETIESEGITLVSYRPLQKVWQAS